MSDDDADRILGVHPHPPRTPSAAELMQIISQSYCGGGRDRGSWSWCRACEARRMLSIGRFTAPGQESDASQTVGASSR